MVFNDRSALILHPGGGECFTYFTPDGKKTRMLTKCAIKKLTDKVNLAVQWVNTYGDTIVVTREDVFKDQTQLLAHKITSAVWPGSDNFEEYSFMDQEGNFHLRSVDNSESEIVLAKNGLTFSVTFLYLLPYKKPQWQEIVVPEKDA